MQQSGGKDINLAAYLLILGLMILMAVWLKSLHLDTDWQKAGLINFSVGFILLIAYVTARILKILKLPMISGYIFTGIIAGPHITGFLSVDMVDRLRLIDDLALSFIALTAGGALQMAAVLKRGRAIGLNTILLTLVVFGLVFFFVTSFGRQFGTIQALSPLQLSALAILLGVISVARSPSSAIAIISECKASGPFTETVLGVTIVMDVLVIILFTISMTVSKVLIFGGAGVDYQVLSGLFIELAASLLIGAVLGKGIAYYIRRVEHDLLLFLLFIALGVTKASFWLAGFMENSFHVHLHLEPLLICMSAGFTVRNFSDTGSSFMESMERMSLPIFVLFFTLAGANLNLKSLLLCWPLAICLSGVRAMGIFFATGLAGIITRVPKIQSQSAWMAYLTQAGVAIGLAQLAERQFPEIGGYLIF